MIGIKTNVITTEKISPKMTAVASGIQISSLNNNGVIPMTVAAEVKMIGLKRLTDESITTS